MDKRATTPAGVSTRKSIPSIKFYKDAVDDIIDGRKTLEPRSRTAVWIRRLERAGLASLTYGPWFGKPTVFATARITDITIRPFETATADDLQRIGTSWQGERPGRFVHEYTRWFAKELAKGYNSCFI